jgi:hypothetical protein
MYLAHENYEFPQIDLQPSPIRDRSPNFAQQFLANPFVSSSIKLEARRNNGITKQAEKVAPIFL